MAKHYAKRNPIEAQESFEHRHNPYSKKILYFSTAMSCLSSFFFGFHTTSMEVLKPLFIGEEKSSGSNITKTDSDGGSVSNTSPTSTSNATSPPDSNDNSEKPRFAGKEITDQIWASLSSIIFFGAILGTFIRILLQINLKIFLMLTIFIFLIGHLLIISFNFVLMFFGRLVIGIAAGCACSSVPTYLNYLSPRKIKGMISAAHQLFIVLGVFAGQLMSYMITDEKLGGILYKGVIVFYVISLILMTGMKNVRNISVSPSKGIRELFACKEAKRSIVMAIVFHIGQQATGVNAVLMFSNDILKKNISKLPFDDYKIGTLFLGLCSIIFTIVSMQVVDRLGRKITVLMSVFVLILSLTLLSFDCTIIFALFLFIAGFALGIGPITWFITNEIFRDEYKTAAVGVAITANWITAFAVTFSFEYLYEMLGSYTFLIYLGVMIFIFVYVLLEFTETKGRKADFQ